MCFAFRCYGRLLGKLRHVIPNVDFQTRTSREEVAVAAARLPRADSQQKAFLDLWRIVSQPSVEPGRAGPDEAVLDIIGRFCLSLVEVFADSDEFRNVVVSFCAASAVSASGVWLRPDIYSKTVSGIITIYKRVFLWEGVRAAQLARLRRSPLPAPADGAGSPGRTALDRATFHSVLEPCAVIDEETIANAHRWFEPDPDVEFRQTPLSIAHGIRNKAMHAAFQESSTIHVNIDQKFEVVWIDDKSVRLVSFPRPADRSLTSNISLP